MGFTMWDSVGRSLGSDSFPLGKNIVLSQNNCQNLSNVLLCGNKQIPGSNFFMQCFLKSDFIFIIRYTIRNESGRFYFSRKNPYDFFHLSNEGANYSWGFTMVLCALLLGSWCKSPGNWTTELFERFYIDSQSRKDKPNMAKHSKGLNILLLNEYKRVSVTF